MEEALASNDLEAIANGFRAVLLQNLESVEALCRLLAQVYHNLPQKESFNRLVKLIELIDDDSFTRQSINSYDEYCHGVNTSSFRFNMFLFAPPALVKKVAAALQIPAERYYRELLNLNDLDTVLLLSAKMKELLPPLTKNQWEALLKEAEESIAEGNREMDPSLHSCNQQVWRFFQCAHGQTKPTWIVDVDAEEIEEQCEGCYLPPGSTLEATMGDDDVALFQEFGPVNRKITTFETEPDSSDDCCRYQGCRMFLCNEFLTYLEDEAPSPWYDGRCDHCGTTVAKIHWALREPLKAGGWSGCFCSFACLRRGRTSTDEHAKERINMMQDMIQEIGIRDR